MEQQPRQRKSEAARRANQVIRNRTMLIMVLLGMVTFVALFVRLFHLQIGQHDEMQELAVNQQTRSAVISASRGTIYDRNGNTLAVSATAETIFISPKEIAEFVEKQEEGHRRGGGKGRREGRVLHGPGGAGSDLHRPGA